MGTEDNECVKFETLSRQLTEEMLLETSVRLAESLGKGMSSILLEPEAGMLKFISSRNHDTSYIAQDNLRKNISV
jgi:hypothetical protein